MSTAIKLLVLAFGQALFFSFPFVLAGLVHILVIKYDLLPSLTSIPLDAGLKFRDRRLFGPNKTLRGAVTMIVSVTILMALEANVCHHTVVGARLAIVDFSLISPWIWGLLLGMGCVIGELPNSCLKRQLDIKPGDRPPLEC